MIEVKTRQGVNTCRTTFDIDTVSIAISFRRMKPTAITMKTGRMTACKICVTMPKVIESTAHPGLES